MLQWAFTPVSGSGGTGPLTYSVSPSLPLGLSVNSVTGLVAGTPTVTSATTPYTVTVTDANGATGTASFNLAINSAVTANTAVASTTLTQGPILRRCSPRCQVAVVQHP